MSQPTKSLSGCLNDAEYLIVQKCVSWNKKIINYLTSFWFQFLKYEDFLFYSVRCKLNISGYSTPKRCVLDSYTLFVWERTKLVLHTLTIITQFNKRPVSPHRVSEVIIHEEHLQELSQHAVWIRPTWKVTHESEPQQPMRRHASDWHIYMNHIRLQIR